MSSFISVLLAFSIAGLALGIISPNFLLGKFINNPTRGFVLKTFGSLFILLLVASIIAGKNKEKSEEPGSEVKNSSIESCSNFKVSQVYNKEGNGPQDPRVFAFSVNMDLSKEECWNRLKDHAKEIHNDNMTYFHIFYTSKDIGRYDFYNKKLPKEIIAVLQANMAQAVFIVDPENYNRKMKTFKIWCSYDCKK